MSNYGKKGSQKPPLAPQYVSPFRRTVRGQIDPKVLETVVGELVELSEKYGNRHFRGRQVIVSHLEQAIYKLLQTQQDENK